MIEVQLNSAPYPLSSLLADGDSNTKLRKSNKKSVEYFTAGLSLAHYNTSGFNVCPSASKGCASACLFYAGYGAYENVQRARIAKTIAFMTQREKFISLLRKDLERFERKANKLNKKLAVRLNVLSDIPWEKYGIIQDFPNVQFYDYTKQLKRMLSDPPHNYHLTFSRSEVNESDSIEVLRKKRNVAVVFNEVPNKWKRFKVVNGDETDLRFLDPKGCVIGLKAKGRAKRDKSGFVVSNVDGLNK